MTDNAAIHFKKIKWLQKFEGKRISGGMQN
jgi:hypothetical protein